MKVEFEPYKVTKIEVADAKEYGKYFKAYREKGEPWHLVGEAYSFLEIGDKKIFKIFPFYALPIQLSIEKKEDIIFLNKEKKGAE